MAPLGALCHIFCYATIRWPEVVEIRDFMSMMLSVMMPVTASGGVLKGAVGDSSGASIPGAMVLIHWDSAGSAVGLKSNIGIKADFNVRSKDDCTFSVDLPPGFYDVFVASPAFSPVCRKVRIKPNTGVTTVFRMSADPLYTAEMGDRIVQAPRKR